MKKIIYTPKLIINIAKRVQMNPWVLESTIEGKKWLQTNGVDVVRNDRGSNCRTRVRVTDL